MRFVEGKLGRGLTLEMSINKITNTKEKKKVSRRGGGDGSVHKVLAALYELGSLGLLIRKPSRISKLWIQ